MKPKVIFLSDEQAIKNAYGPDTMAALSAQAEILPGFYPSVSGLPAAAEAEYAFSTWGMPVMTEEEIRQNLPNLRALFYAAGSVQAFARPFLACGVKVFSAWGANAVPVAEVTVSEILLANKGFFQTLHRGGAGGWPEHDAGRPYPGNYDTPVGIIGVGMIGRLVIGMLRSYRLKVLVYDPFLPEEKASQLGAEKVASLPELFRRCQVVSNHLANNPQTVNMIDKTCFDAMGRNAVFINTGRGQQVVEADLVSALRSCPTRAAVLDVTWPEPPEADSPLYKLPNVFLTPHMAGSLGAEVRRMGEYMLEEFTALIQNEPTRYQVTPEMLATMA